MQYEGNEAAAMAADLGGYEVVEDTNEVSDEGVIVGSDSGDFIVTEAAEAEKPKTLKHRGSIASIVAITSAQKGSRGIEINAHSDSNGGDYKTTIWPPQEWAKNVFITRDELAKLPRPEGTTAKGNPKNSPLDNFRRTIASTDGSADLQRLLKAGKKADRVPAGGYKDFDGLVENLNSAFQGCPVVFTTGPDGEADPEYGFRIKVRSIFAFDMNFDKLKAEDASGA